MRISGWTGLLLWALVGGLYGLTYLAMMSIGVFILPFTVIATIVAARRLRLWPEILGLVLGPALVMMRLASGSWGIRRCGAGEQAHMEMSASGSGSVASGTYTEVMRFDGCVDLNAPLLMYSAVALIIGALGVYLVAKYRMARTVTR